MIDSTGLRVDNRNVVESHRSATSKQRHRRRHDAVSTLTPSRYVTVWSRCVSPRSPFSFLQLSSVVLPPQLSNSTNLTSSSEGRKKGKIQLFAMYFQRRIELLSHLRVCRWPMVRRRDRSPFARAEMPLHTDFSEITQQGCLP